MLKYKAVHHLTLANFISNTFDLEGTLCLSVLSSTVGPIISALNVCVRISDEPKVSRSNVKCFGPFLTQHTTYSDDEIDFHVAEGDDDYGYEPSTSASRSTRLGGIQP